MNELNNKANINETVVDIQEIDLKSTDVPAEFKGLDKDCKGIEVELGTVETRIIGMDGGASRLRAVGISDADPRTLGSQLNNYTIIPSECKFIDIDSTHLESNNSTLYSNMDTVISSESNPLLTSPKRLIRGHLRESQGGNPELVKSRGFKKDMEIFYLNLIDTIHLNIVSTLEDDEALAEKYRIYISLALPPQEINDEGDKIDLRDKLVGTYTVENKQLGYKFDIEIVEVLTETESALYHIGYSVLEGGAEFLSSNTMSVNIGSRSTGLDIIDNKNRIVNISSTFPLGGRAMLIDLQKELSSIKIQITDMKQLEKIISEGYVTKGAKTIVPVGDIIEKVKRKFAGDLSKEISAKLDNLSYDANVIENFLISGGSARPTVYYNTEDLKEHLDEDGDLRVLSVGDYLVETLEELEDADYTLSDGEYIVQGSAYLAYNKYRTFLQDDEL